MSSSEEERKRWEGWYGRKRNTSLNKFQRKNFRFSKKGKKKRDFISPVEGKKGKEGKAPSTSIQKGGAGKRKRGKFRRSPAKGKKEICLFVRGVRRGRLQRSLSKPHRTEGRGGGGDTYLIN